VKKNKFKEFEPTIIDSSGSLDDIDFNNENLDPTIFSSDEQVDFEKTRVLRKTPPCFAWLVCIDNPLLGQRYDVNDEVTSIGRDANNSVVIGEDSISNNHAKIKYDAEKDGYKLYDLVSTNGTYVNGDIVEAPVQLQDNDEVMFGEVKFIFKRVLCKINKKKTAVE